MAYLKTPEEIRLLREGGKILAAILRAVAGVVRPGVSTLELDQIARAEIKKHQVTPAFEGYKMGEDYPEYPAVLCASVDEEVVHGIPKEDRVLKEGEIVGLDLGIIHRNLYTDAAVTVPVGKISAENEKLIQVTKNALHAGIKQVKPGNTIGDVAAAIQAVADETGLSVVRDLIGHGVGHALHEKPDVPNYGQAGTLEKLQTGMVIAIEPMFTRGDYKIKFLDDGWTVVTADGSQAAHFEHSVAVTETGHLILTDL